MDPSWDVYQNMLDKLSGEGDDMKLWGAWEGPFNIQFLSTQAINLQ
jgi:hypothetical protein